MKKLSIVGISLLLIMLFAGCNPVAQPTATEIVEPTKTPYVLPTLEPILPTSTNAPPTATPAQFKMLTAEVIYDNYSLRVGPGRLFARVNMYLIGESVKVIGREPGNNWVLVQVVSDHRSGWMNAVGLTISGEITTLPVYEVQNAQVLQGHVYLPDGRPATRIGVSLAPNTSDLSASSDVSETNNAGEWYIYTPTDLKGAFIVGPNSFTCDVSNAVVSTEGSGCTLLGNLPPAQEIALPYTGAAIDFEIIPLP